MTQTERPPNATPERSQVSFVTLRRSRISRWRFRQADYKPHAGDASSGRIAPPIFQSVSFRHGQRLSPRQSCSDCTIATRGYSFREGQVPRLRKTVNWWILLPKQPSCDEKYHGK